ncbi:hypothetical protein D3C72_2295500 [compost metagenome]
MRMRHCLTCLIPLVEAHRLLARIGHIYFLTQPCARIFHNSLELHPLIQCIIHWLRNMPLRGKKPSRLLCLASLLIRLKE